MVSWLDKTTIMVKGIMLDPYEPRYLMVKHQLFKVNYINPRGIMLDPHYILLIFDGKTPAIFVRKLGVVYFHKWIYHSGDGSLPSASTERWLWFTAPRGITAYSHEAPRILLPLDGTNSCQIQNHWMPPKIEVIQG